MRNRKSRILTLIILIIFLDINLTRVNACICSIEPEAAFNQSVGVFRGKVINVKDYSDESSFRKLVRLIKDEAEIKALISVNQVWKGEVRESEFVYTNNLLCDFAFEPGQEYIIYAFKLSNGEYYAPKCAGTRYIKYARNHLEYLSKITPINTQSTNTQSINTQSIPNNYTFYLMLYCFLILLSASSIFYFMRKIKKP